MRRPLTLILLVIVLVAGMAVVAWDALSNSRAAARLPAELKERILGSFHGDVTSQTIKASQQDGDTFYVAVSSTNALTTVVYSYVFVVHDQDCRSFVMSGRSEAFSSEAGYELGTQTYYVMGLTTDREVTEVIGLAANGRETKAELFGGYWIMFPPMQSEDTDRIVKVTARDRAGKTLYENEPELTHPRP